MQRFSQYLLTPAFFITCIHFAPAATAAEQRNSTSMQLPTWVESIGKPSTNQIDGVAPEEAIVPVVQPSVISKTASDSSRNKATAPLQKEQKQISGPTISTLSKPTLSERAAQLFDPKVLKTAWNDLLPSPKEKQNEPVSEKSTPKNEGASLGPETSILKQGKSDESPSWQRPLAAARSLLQAPPNVNETSAIETTGSSNNKSKTVSSIADEPLKVAPLNAPIAEAPDETPTLAIDPASFRGAYPGKTTRADIDNEWGTGVAIPRDDGTECFFWEIEPFDRVAVFFPNEASCLALKPVRLPLQPYCLNRSIPIHLYYAQRVK